MSLAGVDLPGWSILVGDLLLGMILLLRPLRRPSRDDRGDGLAQVLLPPNRAVGAGRTLTYFGSLAILSTVLVALPGLVPGYRALVGRVARSASGHAELVAAYAGHLDANLRLLVVLEIVCLAMVIPGGIGRRLAVAMHAAGFLVLAVGADALVVIVSGSLGLTSASYAFASVIVNLSLSGLVMLHLLITSFALPTRSAVPVSGRSRWASLMMLASLIAVAALLLAGLAVIGLVATRDPNVGLGLFLGYPLLLSGLYVLLLALGGRTRRPAWSGPPPLIDVIMPAYNETRDIARTLRAIDRAAARYRGAINVIIGDDGSTDGTDRLARRTMEDFAAATGEVVTIPHSGKAAALNAALRHATAEIVVRIDADVQVDPDGFSPIPAWFRDPSVGSVGATMLPDPGVRTFWHRMRLFECLYSFSFARPALSRADAISCIPGTFTALRRSATLALGGYVGGMNGEDADLTMQLGRLGLRSVIDPDVRAYEDVPRSYLEFRHQRLRWNRAGIHVMARHSPISGGESSPRTWFLFLRTGAIRVSALLRPLVYLHAVQVAMFEPALRREWGLLLVLYAIGAVPLFIPVMWQSIRRGFVLHLGWFVFWYPFTAIRRVFVLESLLTLPPRPLPSLGRKGHRSASTSLAARRPERTAPSM
jgi:cellulose synthase/poly-beta-1,6-N-acetylglucosamine synthase-like glycosyltransferase